MMERALPRVLILDVEMPRLSGFQLLKIMRAFVAVSAGACRHADLARRR